MCKYKHKTCIKIDYEKKGKITGTGCIILNNYKQNNIVFPVAYFILEKYGNYKGHYSIIGGNLDNNEDCYIKSALRELMEEAKIKIDIKDFGKFFKDKLGNTKYFWHHNTPIFVGKIPSLSRTIIRKYIQRDNKDKALPSHYKETLDIECIRLDNHLTPENKQIPLSNYAISVLRNNNLYNYL